MPSAIRLAWRLRFWIAGADLLRRPRVLIAGVGWPAGRPRILVPLVAGLTWRPRLRIPGSAVLRGCPLFRVSRAAVLRGGPLFRVSRAAMLRSCPLLPLLRVVRAAVLPRSLLLVRPLLRVVRAAPRRPLLRGRPLLRRCPLLGRRPLLRVALADLLAGHPRIAVAWPFLVLGRFRPAPGVVTLMGPGVVIRGAVCRPLMLVLHPSAAH